MAKPIARTVTESVRAPAASGLIAEFIALMPPGTSVYIVAVGPQGAQGREAVVGGDTDNIDARLGAAQALLNDPADSTLVARYPLAAGLN